jgi:uncharacterized protein (TIGR04562 family)
MSSHLGKQLRNLYSFSNEIFDVIIGGKSTLDATSLFETRDLDEADRFLQSYGYNLENPIEKAEVLGNFHEALNFIRKHFLFPDNPDGLKLEIPRKILELSDMRELFLLSSAKHPSQSSESGGEILRSWACSVLKVMHTIAHIDKDVRTSYYSDIQKQIFDRFYKLIHRDPEGQLFLGEKESDPHRINLIAFETKPKKSRDSIILKLLHKPENVAEDIFDRVGIRFVTPTAVDTLRVIKTLRDKMVIMPANIKPSRSRNTLLQIDEFKKKLPDLLLKVEESSLSKSEFIEELESASRPPGLNPDNPHSSEFYRAVQFTCRQLIKLTNPLYDEIRELKNVSKQKLSPEEILKIIERIDLKYLQREIRFFYPYEVQLVDQKNHEENEKGKSAHSEYKRSQVLAAIQRVMGPLVHVAR